MEYVIMMQESSGQTLKICSQKIPIIVLAFGLASISVVPSKLVAENKWQNHADLLSAVKNYVSKNIDTPISDYNLTINNIDSRLRLHQCDSPVTAFLPTSGALSGKTTVGLRCHGKRPWKIYIPIQITRYKDIIVSKHPLLKGQTIDRSSITIAKVELTSTNQAYFTDDNYVIGKILKRALAAGKPIKARYLKVANIVVRGQEVILKATTASIQVIMSGKALTDGAEGELIRVRNSKTHRIVEGIVTKSGTVQVRM